MYSKSNIKSDSNNSFKVKWYFNKLQNHFQKNKISVLLSKMLKFAVFFAMMFCLAELGEFLISYRCKNITINVPRVISKEKKLIVCFEQITLHTFF